MFDGALAQMVQQATERGGFEFVPGFSSMAHSSRCAINIDTTRGLKAIPDGRSRDGGANEVAPSAQQLSSALTRLGVNGACNRRPVSAAPL
jgi:hypothetical protein